MPEICFASNNSHKLEEVRRLIPGFRILTLAEIGCSVELPEEQDTISGNSRQKAEFVLKHYGVTCFADDSGLEVAALGGAPGVHSAYYGGPQRDASLNTARLLRELEGRQERSARFITVINLASPASVLQFEGVLEGTIAHAPRGNQGFGYDPVFIPQGYDRTLAEMTMEEKNSISHRFRAVSALAAYLRRD